MRGSAGACRLVVLDLCRLGAVRAVGSPAVSLAGAIVTQRVVVRHRVAGGMSVRRAREGTGKHQSAGGEDRGEEPAMDLCG
jgi:hypothetical protein